MCQALLRATVLCISKLMEQDNKKHADGPSNHLLSLVATCKTTLPP